MSNPAETVSTNPCPHCLKQGKVSYLRNRQGTFYAYCEGETHRFPDSDELTAQINQAKLQFPEHFPQKKITSDAPPKQLSFFTVDPENKKAIEEIVGHPVEGASELKSILYGLKNEVAELNRQAQTAKATGIAAGMKSAAKTGDGGIALRDDQVVFQIDENLLEAIKDSAGFEDKSVQEYLQEQFGAFVETFYTYQQPKSA